MTEPEQCTIASRRRRVFSGLLYLAILGAGIWASYQIHLFRESRQASGPAGRPKPGLMRWSATMPSRVAASAPATPARITDGIVAQAAAGLTPLEGDPGQLAPPNGAVRLWAVREESGDQTSENANYDYPGSADEVLEYYRGALARMGFKPLDVAAIGADRGIAFWKDQIHVTVSLRKARPDARMLRVSVTFIEWNGQDQPKDQPGYRD